MLTRNTEGRYQKGKIYKIWSPSTDLTYIGSTCDDLNKRLYGHRIGYKHWKKTGKKYLTSFKVLEHKDHRIDLIEDYPCECRKELQAREGKYIREIDCINKAIAGRTRKEWREANKEQILLKKKEYNEKNREQILLKKKEYYKDNKEIIDLKKKEWREKNREKIALKHKEWYETNKEKINERKREKVKCECGSEVTRAALNRHKKTKKHIRLLDIINQS